MCMCVNKEAISDFCVLALTYHIRVPEVELYYIENYML